LAQKSGASIHIAKKADYPHSVLRKILSTPRTADSWSALINDHGLTYEASHPIACDGCYHARTVAGGESLLSAVIAASGNYPDFSELVFVARSSAFCNEVLAHPPTWLIGFPIIQRGRCSVELYSLVPEGKISKKKAEPPARRQLCEYLPLLP